MLLEIALTLFVLLLLYKVVQMHGRTARQRNWNLPRGPPGLPILGNSLPLLTTSSPYLKLSEWANTYGVIYTANILTKDVLVVSCPKLMRQIYEHPASTGKYCFEPLLLLSGGLYGILSTEGQTWLEQRKFCLRTLHQFGMGKRNEIQSAILSEAELAVERIKKEIRENNGIIDSPFNLLSIVMNNTLWKIIRGDRFPMDDKRVKKITGDYVDAINASVRTGLALFPWLKWIVPKWSGYTGLVDSSRELHQLIREQFHEHIEHRIMEGEWNKEEPHDMLDVYLDKMEKANKNGISISTFYGEEGWKHSVAVIAEMFAAGGESTPHTLNWLILYVIHNPNVQRKLHEEIDQVVGTLEPCLQHKSRMPYTEAVILEILRKCSAFPLSTLHVVTEDVDVCGYKLPKGLLLQANIYQAHMNKQFWGDPEMFRPERFISVSDEDKDIVSERRASVVPFGVGKRACPGEPLAMDALFLFVVKLFQAFTLHPFPENVKPDFESSEPFLITANPFQVVFKERKSL